MLSILAAIGLFVSEPAFAFTIPPNDGFITDQVGLLTWQQEEGIEARLQAYQRSTSNEIAILIVSTLNGRPEAEVAVDVIRKWGIGTSENNNGVLLLHMYDDRRVYIAVGYGLEGVLPDLVVDGIIQTDIAPDFREGDYALGYSKAIDALEKHIGNEYTAERYKARSDSFHRILFILFLLFEPIAAILGRTRSWWLGGIFGLAGGIVLVALYGWWLSIPILTIIGLFFDYIVSRSAIGMGNSRYRRGSSGYYRSSSRRSRSTFGGFGGGSAGGGGAGRSY